MEVKFKVETIGRKYLCDKCKKGDMMATGLGTEKEPKRYQHICNNCGEEILLDKQYPGVEWKEIKEK